jgi:hypothetical protein
LIWATVSVATRAWFLMAVMRGMAFLFAVRLNALLYRSILRQAEAKNWEFFRLESAA